MNFSGRPRVAAKVDWQWGAERCGSDRILSLLLFCRWHTNLRSSYSNSLCHVWIASSSCVKFHTTVLELAKKSTFCKYSTREIEITAKFGRILGRWIVLACRLYGLRQQSDREQGQPCICISDFVTPSDSNRPTDYIGAFACTAGIGAKELCKSLEKNFFDDYSSIMVWLWQSFKLSNVWLCLDRRFRSADLFVH